MDERMDECAPLGERREEVGSRAQASKLWPVAGVVLCVVASQTPLLPPPAAACRPNLLTIPIWHPSCFRFFFRLIESHRSL